MNFKKSLELIQSLKTQFNIDLVVKSKFDSCEYILGYADGEYLIICNDYKHSEDASTRVTFENSSELKSHAYNFYSALTWVIVDPLILLDALYKKQTTFDELCFELNDNGFNGDLNYKVFDGIYQNLESALSDACSITRASHETVALIEHNNARPHYYVYIASEPEDVDDLVHLNVGTDEKSDFTEMLFNPVTNELTTTSEHAGFHVVQYWRICTLLEAKQWFSNID